jgi:isopentenyldiphosphate isomerase
MDNSEIDAPAELRPSTSLPEVVMTVTAEDYQLTNTAYHAVERLFEQSQFSPAMLQAIRTGAKEYGQEEFLLCVDHHGTPASISQKTLEDFHTKADRYPDFQLWFRPAQLDNDQPTLLIARWLCHLVGFRHRAVLLFLDHPELADHTLLQIRAFDKAEAPGCLDVPAAGHVTDIETVEAGLRKELAEELGVDLDRLADFAQIASYDYSGPSSFRNVEYRIVFYARLRSEDWLRLRVDEREVAAVAAFSIAAVQITIAQFPEHVASGLRASFAYYLKHTEPKRGRQKPREAED